MSSLADVIIKGGVGAVGIVTSAYTLTKFIIATPVKIGARRDDEKMMDIVLCFNSKVFPRSTIEYFISIVKEQSQILIAEKLPKSALKQENEEVYFLVGATHTTLKHIKEQKEKNVHASLVDEKSLMGFSSGERIDLLMFELNRLIVCTPAIGSTASIPKPFEENDSLLAQSFQSKLLNYCFPLHDHTERQELVETWVKKWKDRQPIDLIHRYFGEEIGFYFAFLGVYTHWLVLPTVLGVLAFAVDILSSWGAYGRAIFSLFVTSWATAFLKFWKRRESLLRNQWDINTTDLLDLDQERPDFTGERRFDPIEFRHFTYFSPIKRMQRYLLTSVVTIAVLASILQLMFTYFLVEQWFAETVTPEKVWHGYYQYISLLPSVSYSVVVLLLDMKYLDLATYLTKYENHRTDADFANALVLKLASFYFVNNFGSLFFLAFRARNMNQLQQTLSSLLITRQLIGNVKEQLVPYFTATSSLKTEAGKIAKEFHVAEAILGQVDAEILFPTYDGTFDDYLELFVQFGQVTLFASAYPLAALWCLANNVIEIRSDAFKLCTNFRRPNRISSHGIGTWMYAFNVLGYLSVATNCAIFGLYSGLLDKLFPGLSFGGILVTIGIMEHVMIGIKVCIEMIVPDTPSSVVDAERMKRAALRKKAITQVELSIRKLKMEQKNAETGVLQVELNEPISVDPTNPQQVAVWMHQEKVRRKKLEEEVKTLNELYLGWIREEREKRQSTEVQLTAFLANK